MDIHQDHSTVTDEAIRAFKRTNIFGYELPWNDLQLPSTCLIKIEENDLKIKIEAIQQYKSQYGRSYSSQKFQEALAITRGMRIGVEYAEAFEVVRVVM